MTLLFVVKIMQSSDSLNSRKSAQSSFASIISVKMAKRLRAPNFSKHEVPVLTELISNKPIIENKSKTIGIEEEKNKSWDAIWLQFNSRENVNPRDIKQLKVSVPVLQTYSQLFNRQFHSFFTV